MVRQTHPQGILSLRAQMAYRRHVLLGRAALRSGPISAPSAGANARLASRPHPRRAVRLGSAQAPMQGSVCGRIALGPATSGAPDGDHAAHRTRDGTPCLMAHRRYYYDNRNSNRCGNCGASVTDRRSHCDSCRATAEARRSRYRSESRCIKCGNPLEEKRYSTCAKCRAAHQAAKRKYRAEGRCTDCGRKSDAHSRCKPCRHKRRLYKLSRLAQGVPQSRA